MRNQIGKMSFFEQGPATKPYSKNLEYLSLGLSTFLRIPKIITKENEEELAQNLQKIQEDHNTVISFIPTQEEYENYYSQFNEFDFFDVNRKVNPDACLDNLDQISCSFESRDVNFYVLRDFESAKRYGLYDFRKVIRLIFVKISESCTTTLLASLSNTKI